MTDLPHTSRRVFQTQNMSTVPLVLSIVYDVFCLSKQKIYDRRVGESNRTFRIRTAAFFSAIVLTECTHLLAKKHFTRDFALIKCFIVKTHKLTQFSLNEAFHYSTSIFCACLKIFVFLLVLSSSTRAKMCEVIFLTNVHVTAA